MMLTPATSLLTVGTADPLRRVNQLCFLRSEGPRFRVPRVHVVQCPGNGQKDETPLYSISLLIRASGVEIKDGEELPR